MVSGAIIVILLAVAASLGSWLFSQWLGIRQRSTALVLTLGVAGVAVLIGAAAFAIIATPNWWNSFVPKLESPAPASAGSQSTAFPPSSGLAATRADDAQARGERWPATRCIKPAVDAAAPVQFIDNECDRVVAVVFAACDRGESVCDQSRPSTPVWRYEPAGIVMTSALQRPSSYRLGGKGPLMAPTYAVNAPGRRPQRIGYVACYVTQPHALGFLNGAGAGTSDEEQRDQLNLALNTDACYMRVMSLSQTGQSLGRAPQALVDDGLVSD